MMLTCCEVQFKHYVVITRCGLVVMNYMDSSRQFIENVMKQGNAKMHSFRRALLHFQRDLFRDLTAGDAFTQQSLADVLRKYKMEIKFLPYEDKYELQQNAAVRYHRNEPVATATEPPVAQDDDSVHPASKTSVLWWEAFQRYYDDDDSDQFVHIRVNLDIIIGPDGKKIRSNLPREMNNAILGLSSNPTTSGNYQRPLLPF